ncbi:peptidylprolyl isomerase [Agarilytica rhodophyticola]|uniref:peptidylprolyl isomerase n=1 Tax=Agarilytica rhodophyticola TaxID=1737490 RepID=UPI000B34118A|nr:peptidylprolyl isomerase [Agarilytica rhodophyticola]
MRLLKKSLQAALFTALVPNLAFAAVEILDRVVATIDEDVITQTELDSRVNEVTQRSESAGVRLPPANVLREQILDQLINETLQLSTARRYGVTVSDQEVLNAMGNLMKNRKWDEAALMRQLQSEGTSVEEFKGQLRRQLTMQNISQGLVRSRIKIAEQDVDNFLKSADAKFWISPDYNLSHILVSLPPSADVKTSKEAEDKAMSIYQRLKDGAKFEELALAESDGPLALKGGAMGWRKSSDLPTLFADIAPKLDEGEVSRPERSRAGFHILKLNGKRGETKQIVNQTKARHILLKTSAILNDDQAQAKLAEFRRSVLEEDADFAELAKEHSEDIASKLSGGDLGWASPGQFVPAFEQNMAVTKIGNISEPFKSQFGWHILQVQDRRAEDMTEQAIRTRARNVLMSRRFEDEVQLWIQEMRDNAFIEIKI